MKDATSDTPKSLVEKDTGVQMVRKAKESVAFIVNVLNPAWKDPSAYASGTQLGDALIVCKQAAWQRNEEDKKKQAAKKNTEYLLRPFHPMWQNKGVARISLRRIAFRKVTRLIYFSFCI